MRLYHATHNDLPIGDSLITPTGRGDGSVIDGGAVYLTSDIKSCERYGAFIFEIAVKNAIAYKTALQEVGRKKKPRYTRNVFVAKPADTEILRRIV